MFIPEKNREMGRFIYTNQITMTGSAVSLGSAQEVKNGIIVEAMSTNSASLYVGASGVTTATGYELQPGGSTSLAIDDIAKVYAIGTSGDKVCFITTD
jgi:hypothetical protein